MSARNKALAVGALVAVAGTAFLFAFTFLKKGGYSASESYAVHARFADATGLTWKSKVQIAGIQIGEVSRITLDRAQARLELRIKNEVQLHTDACLYKTFPSALLPDALLDVTPGSDGAPLLSSLPEEQREITCIREATSIQQLVDVLSKIANDVQTVTGDLAQTVRGNEGSLKDIVENLARLTKRVDQIVAENQGQVNAIVANVRGFTGDLREISGREKERIHSIMANLDALSAELRVVAASAQGILSGNEPALPGPAASGGAGGRAGAAAAGGFAGLYSGPVASGGAAGAAGAPGTGAPGAPGVAGGGPSGAAPQPSTAEAPLAGAPIVAGVAAAPAGTTGPVALAPTTDQRKGVQQAVARLNDSLARLNELLTKVDEGKSVAGKLLTDERLGRRFGSAVEGVAGYVDRLQKMQIEMNLRSEWLLNQSISTGRPGSKIYVSARLIPRPDKFYLFEVVSDPRGVDTTSTETVTTRQPGSNTETTTVVKRTTNNPNQLAFSLQIAKRYGPITFRAGLIESSGGIGADFHMLDEALKLSLSLYQFSRVATNVYPRAKIWVDYNFLQHFYVTTGVDDFLNKWQSATSVGGQSFNIGTDVFFGAGIVFTDDDLKTLLLSGAGSAAGSASR
jgi:phospholipid/cholesterol/gamma-HCH transport system substrate-binding protein